nr:hypothetical protein [uncultured Psychroserpens sp.]
MRFISILCLLFIISCTTYISDEELKQRFDKAYTDKNWESSKSLIDEIIVRDSTQSENYLTRALILSHLKNRDNTQIIEDLNVYLEAFPNDDVIKVFRFQTYYLDNQLNKALEGVDALIEIKGKSAYLLAWKGNIAFASKKFKIAERAYKERLALNGSLEDLKSTYYYWVFSKHFGGNTESALWEIAALGDRGFKPNYKLLKQIENNELVFEDLANFDVPNSNLDEVYNAITSQCSEFEIFEGNGYRKSAVLNQFFYLEKTTDLKSLLTIKEDVYSLNLSYSGINELPLDLFEFKNLQYLNLSGNRFKDNDKLFNDLAKFPDLAILELDRCYLRSLPDGIKNLKNLLVLSMQFNDFRTLNENIGALTNLKYLDIGSNGKLRDLPQSIGQLRCLQLLNVSPNGLNRLRDELANCTQLVSIVGNAGTIKTLPRDIDRLINLKHINLVANKITELPASIGELSSLEHLSLGSNDIRKLPKSFSNFNKLNFCGLSYNRLNSFPKEIVNIDSLVTIWIHNNSFKQIPLEIAKIKNLQRILVDHEMITDQNIDSLKQINPSLYIIREDTRQYAKGPKRKK